MRGYILEKFGENRNFSGKKGVGGIQDGFCYLAAGTSRNFYVKPKQAGLSSERNCFT